MAATLRKFQTEDTAEEAVADYVRANERKSLLRFITCGSVDDGKSTLIGRLLYDSKMLFEDQVASLEADSRRSGKQDETLDFALLVDGLAAEREQGITIDVAYRFFATAKRKFIVADTPGHEQYTRNMATGASTADLAILLVDARQGVLKQTRRHSHIAQLLGIRSIVLAVNKMDLIGYDQSRFDEIVADYAAFAAEAGIGSFTAIPVSGLVGDNVTVRSANMRWYRGPVLLDHLETVQIGASGNRSLQGDQCFRFPVQWVSRPDQSFRGYAGSVASGTIRVGAQVRIEPAGHRTRIERIVTWDGDLEEAAAGQAVTLVLEDELDCARGDVIVSVGADISVRDRFDATLVWMSNERLVPGRAYWLKIGTRMVAASVSRVHDLRQVDTMSRTEPRLLGLNDIGRCEIVLDRLVAATSYGDSRKLGAFILIDRASHATAAAGMIDAFPDNNAGTESVEGGVGRVIWLVGSSYNERMEFARRAQVRLRARGRPTLVLDSCAVRAGLSSDLGHGAADEAENQRRTSEVARLMSLAGVTVLIASDPPVGGDRPGTEIDVQGADSGWDWMI